MSEQVRSKLESTYQGTNRVMDQKYDQHINKKAVEVNDQNLGKQMNQSKVRLTNTGCSAGTDKNYVLIAGTRKQPIN